MSFSTIAHMRQCGIGACVECINNTCLRCLDSHVSPPDGVPWWDGRLAGEWQVTNDGDACTLPFEKWFVRITVGFIIFTIVIVILGAIGQTLIIHCTRMAKTATRHLPENIQVMSLENITLLDAMSDSQFGRTDQGAEDNMSNSEKSREAIRHGLRSWYNTRFQDWRQNAPQRYSFGRLHDTFVVGVGLPLFYNFHFLPLITGILGAIATYWASSKAGVVVPFTFNIDDNVTAIDLAEKADNIATIDADVQTFARAMFFATSLLYWVLLVITLGFAQCQRRFKMRYDAQTSCMADYTVQVEGVPESIVHESELLELVEAQLQCPGEVLGVSIGYNLAKDRMCDEVFQLLEACFEDCDTKFQPYNQDLEWFGYPQNLSKATGDEGKRFRALLPNLRGSGRAFIVFRSKGKVDQMRISRSGFWVDATVDLQSDREVANLCRAMNVSPTRVLHMHRGHRQPLRRMTSTLADREVEVESCQLLHPVVIGAQILNEGTYVIDPGSVEVGSAVRLKQFVSMRECHQGDEPVSIQWYNLGTLPAEMLRNKLKAVIAVISVFLIIVLVVYFPLAYFLMIPYAIAQVPSSFLTGQAQGMIFGISNNLINIMLWIKVHDIGHARKYQLDEAFMLASTATGFFNTFYFLLSALYLQISLGFSAVNVGGEVTRIDLEKELTLAEAFFHTLVPGWLFTGVLIGEVMGKAVPLAQNYFLTHVVYVWKCLPKPLNRLLTLFIPWNPPSDEFLGARMAEHVFQPVELAMAWNYPNYIILPTTCLMTLFILSPYTWKMFVALTGWTLFMLAFHRFSILFLSRKAIHTSPHLEENAERLWGIPLSIIATAACYWGVRSQIIPNKTGRTYWIVPVTFFLSHWLYRLTLWAMGDMSERVFDISSDGYVETEKSLRYTWFNSNPIHVLKSRHCPDQLGWRRVETPIPFEYGKEYLLLDEREEPIQTERMSRCDSAQSSMGFEYPEDGQAAIAQLAGL